MRSDRETEEMELSSVSSSPTLTPRSDSQSSVVGDDGALLDSLSDLLWDFSVLAPQLQANIEEAQSIVAPSRLVAGVRSFFSMKPHPEKQALTELLSLIDSQQLLGSQLEWCLRTAQGYRDDFLLNLKLGIQEIRQVSKNSIALHAQASHDKLLEKLKNEYEEFDRIRAQNFKESQEYKIRIEQARNQCGWVDKGRAEVKRALDAATKCNDELKDLRGRLEGVMLNKPEILSEVQLSPSRVEEKAQRLTLQFEDLTNKAANAQQAFGKLESELEVTSKVNTLRDSLDVLERVYGEAQKDYQALLSVQKGSTYGTGSSMELEIRRNQLQRSVNECLAAGSNAESNNEGQVLLALGRYLKGGATKTNTKNAIEQLLKARGQAAAEFKPRLLDLSAKIKRFQENIELIKKNLADLDQKYSELKLPTEDAMSNARVNLSRPKQAVALREGSRDVVTHQQILGRIFFALEENEGALLSVKEGLNLAKNVNQEDILNLYDFLVADKQKCPFENSENQMLDAQRAIKPEIAVISEEISKVSKIKKKLEGVLQKIQDARVYVRRDKVYENAVKTRNEIDYLKGEVKKRRDQIIQRMDEIAKLWKDWESKKFREQFTIEMPAIELTHLRNLISEDVFKQKVAAVHSAYSSLRLYPMPASKPTVEEDDALRKKGELYFKIVVGYRGLAVILGKINHYFVKNMPELSRPLAQGEQSSYVEAMSLAYKGLVAFVGELKSEAVAAQLSRFYKVYNQASWEYEEPYTTNELESLLHYPTELINHMDELYVNAESLFVKDGNEDEEQEASVEGGLLKKQELVLAHLAKFKKYNDTLAYFHGNIALYLQHLRLYKQRALYCGETEHKIEALLHQLKERKQALERLKLTNAKSQEMLANIASVTKKINDNRYDLFALLRNMNLSDLAGRIDLSLSKIEAENKFRSDVVLLFNRISALKDRNAARKYEIFFRVKREFLLSGKSGAIIERLKAHRQGPHAQTAKGGLIDRFLSGLFTAINGYTLGEMTDKSRDPGKIYLEATDNGVNYEVLGIDGLKKRDTISWDKFPPGTPRNMHDDLLPVILQHAASKGYLFCDLAHLQTYLEDAFTGKHGNQALIKSGNALVTSTTKRLIGDLRNELEVLRQRENQNPLQSGSINLALQHDCHRLGLEYKHLLNEKNLSAEAPSLKPIKDCEALVAEWALRPDPALPSDTIKKIQQDLIEIQNSVGHDRVDPATRYARMLCAIEIRKNECLSQNQNIVRLADLYKKYQFSFTCQSFKCYIEKAPTNRVRDKQRLFRQLDIIANGLGDEDEKYTVMKKCVFDFYVKLRESDNGSAGYFFGRGSRLADRIEDFLVKPEVHLTQDQETLNRGFGFKRGNRVKEVNHYRQDGYHGFKGFFYKAAHHLSEVLYCYERSNRPN